MNINIKDLFALSLLLLLLPNCTETKSETAKEQKQKPEIPSYIKAFEDTLTSRLAEEKIPGAALAIVSDSTIIYMQTFGLTNSDSNTAIDSSTVFRLASLSKGFAGVLSGILVDEGLLKWTDPVVKYYPDFSLKDSAQTARVQLRHLLSHSSGLPYHAYTNLIEDGLSLEDIIPRLAKLDLIATEGEVYAYQNAAFAIIEKVIESAADTTFSAVLENKIFKAAGMHNASASYNGLVKSGNYAKPHHYSALEQRYVPVRNSKKYYNAASAGGINASIRDMAQWMLLLNGSRQDIISDSTLEYIFNPVVKVNTRRYSRRWGARRSEYALGWRVVKFKERSIVFHGGYVNAYRSEIAIDRKNKLGICLLVNAPHWYTSRVIPEFFKSFYIK